MYCIEWTPLHYSVFAWVVSFSTDGKILVDGDCVLVIDSKQLFTKHNPRKPKFCHVLVLNEETQFNLPEEPCLLWTNSNIHVGSVSRRQQQLLQSYKGHELKSAYTSWFSLTYVYTGLLTPHTTLHCRTRSHCKYFWWYPFFAIRKLFGIAWNFWSCTFLCNINVDFDLILQVSGNELLTTLSFE